MLMCQCLSPSSKLIYRSPGLAVSWSRRTVRVVAISMLLAKEWKAVLTRRRRTCQSYIASLGTAAFGHRIARGSYEVQQKLTRTAGIEGAWRGDAALPLVKRLASDAAG